MQVFEIISFFRHCTTITELNPTTCEYTEHLGLVILQTRLRRQILSRREPALKQPPDDEWLLESVDVTL